MKKAERPELRMKIARFEVKESRTGMQRIWDNAGNEYIHPKTGVMKVDEIPVAFLTKTAAEAVALILNELDGSEFYRVVKGEK